MKKVLLLLALLTFPSAAIPQCGGLGADFFGLTFLQSSVAPTVPSKILRLWDTFNPNAAGWNASSNACGTPNFTAVNAWIAKAQSLGEDVMWTGGRTPSCAITGDGGACTGTYAPNGCAQPPSDLTTTDAQWKNFITALVNDSLAQPLHIKYYECVNEFDLAGEWTDTMAHLVTFCGDMQTTIHNLDPNAIVLGPSSSTGNTFGVHGYSTYIPAGGDATYDQANFHLYIEGCGTFCDTPEGIGGGSGGIYEYITQGRLLTAKPITWSEGSWGCNAGNTITDVKKRAWIARSYLILWGTNNGNSRFVWYDWATTNPLGSSCGTLNVCPTCMVAYQTIQPWIIGSSGPNLTKSGTQVTITYTNQSLTPNEIHWDTTSTPTITVPSQYTIQDKVDGTSTAIVSNQITLGPDPIRIR